MKYCFCFVILIISTLSTINCEEFSFASSNIEAGSQIPKKYIMKKIGGENVSP